MNVPCQHQNVTCLNPWEFVRKYRCQDCGAVMMCACDEERGRRFLPHQLARGRDFETSADVPVTTGFQPTICRRCRGLAEEPNPKAALHGATSKIRRYYWREIWFETVERFARARGVDDIEYYGNPALQELWDRCEKDAIAFYENVHKTAPLYTYESRTQDEVISAFDVQVLDLRANYGEVGEERSRVVWQGQLLRPEEYVIRHFESLGYTAFFAESIPFHVLVGAFLWSLVQGPFDQLVRMVMFGDRRDFKAGLKPAEIWTPLPEDFGRASYGTRRATEIAERLSTLPSTANELVAEFERQLDHSDEFRQYLWAIEQEHVDAARRLLTVLPPAAVRNILRYLISSYWDRYLGWPDLLIARDGDFFFAEVKGSGDKLSEEQIKWIEGNHQILKLPFKLVKVHRGNPTKKHKGGSGTNTSFTQ